MLGIFYVPICNLVCMQTNENYEKPKADNNWEYKITLGLAKAMLNILKQYKKKIEVICDCCAKSGSSINVMLVLV